MDAKDFTLTQEELRQYFDYKEGNLYWKTSNCNRVKIGQKAGTLSNNGYVCVRINKKAYKAHRLVFMMFHGYMPYKIDHIDGNPTNNKIENLRPTTSIENGYNSKIPKSNKSGIKGVSWCSKTKKWYVSFRVNGKQKNFGRYSDIKYAKSIVELMRIEHHKEFARNQ